MNGRRASVAVLLAAASVVALAVPAPAGWSAAGRSLAPVDRPAFAADRPATGAPPVGPPAPGAAGRQEQAADFRIRRAAPDDDEPDPLVPGDVEVVTLAVTNLREEPVSDAVVRIQTGDSPLFFGTPAAPRGSLSVFVDRLDPGETGFVRVRVGVAAGVAPETYPLVATVDYRDGNGTPRSSAPIGFGVEVGRQPEFDLLDVEASLRPGERGVVRGTLQNEGNRTVEDVQLVLEPDEPDLLPRETEYLGEIVPGGGADFRFRVDVSNETVPGPRQLTFLVRYETDEGSNATATVREVVRVDRERDAFAVEPVQATLEVDERGVLAVRVTNNRGRPVTDVLATLRPRPPFSSDDPTALVPRLEPGESAVVRFDLEASADAVEGTDGVVVTFAYEEAAELRESEPSVVPVEVVEPTGTEFPAVPAATVVAALVLALAWWWRRR